jgi:hypothetical protein
VGTEDNGDKNMRMVNVIIYLLLITWIIVGFLLKNKDGLKSGQWRRFLKEHLYIWGMLFLVNTISLSMTFIPKSQEVYIEKAGYGKEERDVPILLQKGEDKEEINLTVSARQLESEKLQSKVKEAFAYLEEHMKGNNASLDKVGENLDYSFDIEEFPFDAEFASEDYTLVDSDGVVKNEREYLLSCGYTDQEIEEGIPIQIEVTLWYGEESFRKTFELKVHVKEMSGLEQEFAEVTAFLNAEEQKAIYDEGFYIPRVRDGIQISRRDKESISPEYVLVVGIMLTVLLLLREQENKRKEQERRKDNLIRSYSWFVNELVLMLGAGMQVRNIFAMLIRDYEKGKNVEDYRKPLMEELHMAVRSMELGMTEEQAYYKLGRRLGIPCYVKIMTLLEQNVKRGGKGLISVLEQEDVLALEERKNLAKRYGEEAGTKLLGPMILLLLVVMLMIMIPALWGFVS